MTGRPRSLERADTDPVTADAMVAALGAEFSVVLGASRFERRTRLDTFDGRLGATGLTLEYLVDARAARLELGRAGGEVVVDETGRDLRWPSFTDALPAGRVRDQVSPVAGLRALVVISQERRRLRGVELRNGDGKLVVRLALDEPASRSGSGARLLVRVVRGYDGQARRAARLLLDASLGWVEPAPVPTAGATSRTAGAAARIIVDPGQPAPVFLSGVLAGFAGALRVNLPGVIDDVDTEFLHDFRVALRRTRATLKLGRPGLGAGFSGRWEPEFRWLGEVTSPVRDLDVYELGLPVMAGWLVAGDGADLKPFAEHLRARRADCRGELVRALRSVRCRRLLADWDGELARLAGERVEASAGGNAAGAPGLVPSAGELAVGAIEGASRRVLRGGASITSATPAADLHRLRSRCKELRYAWEVFAPVIEGAAGKGAIADLTALQDVLGRFQDSQVQRAGLEVFAGEMMAQGTTAAALLAMGELVGHLDAEQRRARAEFDGAFARFGGRASERHARVRGEAG